MNEGLSNRFWSHPSQIKDGYIQVTHVKDGPYLRKPDDEQHVVAVEPIEYLEIRSGKVVGKGNIF